MDRIYKVMGDAQILRIERRAKENKEELIGWERRTGYLGFGGYLVIMLTDEGGLYAGIDNGRRCIHTSLGELTVEDGRAVFRTANSIYTFRLLSAESTLSA